MLSACLGIGEIAAHKPAEVDWESLPPECLVAMHWHRDPDLERILQGYGILVTARHPLDVLVSILRFAQYQPATARWLEGEGGNENALIGASPTDGRFLEYALSDRAAALFSVSVDWSEIALAVVRYEDLVVHPRQTLVRVFEALGEIAPANFDTVVEAHRIDKLPPRSPHHAWRGQPGVWRDVIVEEYRHQIYQRHRSAFRALGYTIEGVPAPILKDAQQNWIRLLEQPPAWQAAPATR